jgi:hypothetical protein
MAQNFEYIWRNGVNIILAFCTAGTKDAAIF